MSIDCEVHPVGLVASIGIEKYRCQIFHSRYAHVHGAGSLDDSLPYDAQPDTVLVLWLTDKQLIRIKADTALR